MYTKLGGGGVVVSQLSLYPSSLGGVKIVWELRDVGQEIRMEVKVIVCLLS